MSDEDDDLWCELCGEHGHEEEDCRFNDEGWIQTAVALVLCAIIAVALIVWGLVLAAYAIWVVVRIKRWLAMKLA